MEHLENTLNPLENFVVKSLLFAKTLKKKVARLARRVSFLSLLCLLLWALGVPFKIGFSGSAAESVRLRTETLRRLAFTTFFTSGYLPRYLTGTIIYGPVGTIRSVWDGQGQ